MVNINENGIWKADGNGVGENLLINTTSYFSDEDISYNNRSFVTDKWFTPVPNKNNETHYLAWAKIDSSFVSGEKITISYDVEFFNITPGSGGTFRIYSQECYNNSDIQNIGSGVGVTGTNSVWNTDNIAYGSLDIQEAIPNGIYHYSNTGILAADRTNYKSIIISFRTNYIGSGKYRIKNLKLEKGSIATPWIPNSTDTIYVSDSVGFSEEGDKAKIWSCGSVTGNEFI